MPAEIRKNVEELKKGESDKRRKAWEDKEGPPTKKQKKAEEEKGLQTLCRASPSMCADYVATEKKERGANEKAEKAQKAKEESERLAAEKKKKKPVRYPTEDLDVTIGDKEKKAGMKLKRPAASRTAMPFGTDRLANENFIMSWNFLNVYG